MFMAKGTAPIVTQQLGRGRLRGSNISTGEILGGIRPANVAIESPGRIAALKAAAAKRDVQARNRANVRDINRRE